METTKSQSLNQFFLHNRLVAEKTAAAAAASAGNGDNSTTNDRESEENYEMAAENKLTSLKERIELLKLKGT